MSRAARARGTLALLVVLAGAAARADTRRELHVSVAVSLLPAVREAAAEFENRHPGVSVRLNSGASAVLLQQIRRGAPADLFLSASPLEIDRLESLVGLRPGSRRTLASNRLVIVVPPGRAPPTDPRQLASQEFDLVAVGNPRTSPLGRYTAEALAALELDDTLAPRLVHGESARRVLDYVMRGEVAAGLVYRTDALLLADRVRVGAEIPARAHAPIRYQAAIPGDAPEPGLAASFLELLLSAEGRAWIAARGFGPAE